MNNIPPNIKTLRKINRLTQHELATRLNTSQSTIALWESRGYTGYTISKLYELSETLGVSIETLLSKWNGLHRTTSGNQVARKVF